jgi:hemolysin III
VFGTALVLAYVASTVYHALPPSLRAKAALRRLDHASIHVLIAGTYTPFTLVALRGGWGWSLFGVVWGLAALGVVVVATPLRRFRRATLGLYLASGWLALVAIGPLARALPLGGLVLVIAGGVAYTLGVPFYLSARRFSHAVWHVFVLAGSALHCIAIGAYVL